MTTRTIQSLGYGFGNTPVNIVAKINGVTVFEGEIATDPLANLPTGNPYDQWSSNVVSLYTFTSTVGETASLPTSIEVVNGTLMLAGYSANYSVMPQTIPPTKPVSSGPDTYLILHGEARENVTIDSVVQNYHSSGSDTESGTWWWKVGAGSTITFNTLVDAGLDVIPE